MGRSRLLFILPPSTHLTPIFRKLNSKDNRLATDVAVLDVFHDLVGGLRFQI
jgi:hypothetical protein